jgi:outer membrane protein TolC
MEYVVSAALEHSPEIGQSRAVIRANERQVTASKRAYFLPDLALVSSGSNAFSRSGAGSDAIPGGPDDETWNVSLQVSFPLFTGGSRKAELSQARHDLRASQADLASATDSVEARARIALHRTAGSYPSIELSREAAAAANENLAMVTDAYARGAVSVTDLIDAQESALSAGLAAADAKYAFLSDFIGVLRAMSEFDILLDPESREQWFKQLDDWLRTQKPTDSSPTG